MSTDVTPTMIDLAQMLDSLASCETYPETLYVARWLVEQSAEARELYDRLHARREGQPPLVELAKVFFGVETGVALPEAAYTIRWLAEQSEPARELYARLEGLADDAGVVRYSSNWALEALAANREVDRLLETLDEWRDAREVVQLHMSCEGDAYPQLINVCRARVARAKGAERRRLEQLRNRLQDAARCALEIADPEERLKKLQHSLSALYKPAEKLELVEELIRQLRGTDEEARRT